MRDDSSQSQHFTNTVKRSSRKGNFSHIEDFKFHRHNITDIHKFKSLGEVKDHLTEFKRTLPLGLIKMIINTLMKKHFDEEDIFNAVKNRKEEAESLINKIKQSFSANKEYLSFINNENVKFVSDSQTEKANDFIFYNNCVKDRCENTESIHTNEIKTFKLNEKTLGKSWIKITSNKIHIATDKVEFLGILKKLSEKRDLSDKVWNILKEFCFIKLLEKLCIEDCIENRESFFNSLSELILKKKPRFDLYFIFEEGVIKIDEVELSYVNKINQLKDPLSNFDYVLMPYALKAKSKVIRYSFVEIYRKYHLFEAIYSYFNELKLSSSNKRTSEVKIKQKNESGTAIFSFKYKSTKILQTYLNRVLHPLEITIKQRKGVNFSKILTKYSLSLGISIKNVVNVNKFDLIIDLSTYHNHLIELYEIIVKHSIVLDLFEKGFSPREIRTFIHCDRIYYELCEYSKSETNKTGINAEIVEFFNIIKMSLVNPILIHPQNRHPINWDSIIENKIKNINVLLVEAISRKQFTNYQCDKVSHDLESLDNYVSLTKKENSKGIIHVPTKLKDIVSNSYMKSRIKSMSDENDGAIRFFINYLMNDNSDYNPLQRILNFNGIPEDYIITDKYSVANCGSNSFWFGAPDTLIIEKKTNKVIAVIQIKGKTLTKKRFTPEGVIYQMLELKGIELKSIIKIAYVFIKDYTDKEDNPKVVYEWFISENHTDNSHRNLKNIKKHFKEKIRSLDKAIESSFHETLIQKVLRSRINSDSLFYEYGETIGKKRKIFSSKDLEDFFKVIYRDLRKKTLLPAKLLEKHYGINRKEFQKFIIQEFDNMISFYKKKLIEKITPLDGIGPYKLLAIWEETILNSSFDKYYETLKCA